MHIYVHTYVSTYVKCDLAYMHYLYVQYACQSRDLDFVEICNHQIQYLKACLHDENNVH